MIKRNGDNVFAIASSNQFGGARGAGGGGGASAVSLCPGGTRIPRAAAAAVRMTPPDAHHNTKEANIALSTYVEKWKNKYDDAERKHKAYLLKSEKAKREYDDLNRRYNILQEERNHLDGELRERERELSKLKNVSEKLFNEYQQLKNQHEVDAGVMHKVMAQAGEWYKQNKQLKRRSAVLMQALPAQSLDIDLTDSTDTASDASSNSEAEFLKQTVSELSRQLGALQAELARARLLEFEAHESNVALAQELESCQERCSSQEGEVQELRSQLERHSRVAKLLVDEMAALRDGADKDRLMCETYKTEAQAAKKRVKVLTHQSALLSADMDTEERLALLLHELDQLRAARDSQDLEHRARLHDLQLQLAEKHEETDILVWEEKIRLAEDDATRARQRAERADKLLADAERKLAHAERKLSEVGSKLTATETKLTDTTTKLSVSEHRLTESTIKPKKSNLMSRISYFENGASVEKNEKKIKEIVEEETTIEEERAPSLSISSTSISSIPPTSSPSPSNTPTATSLSISSTDIHTPCTISPTTVTEIPPSPTAPPPPCPPCPPLPPCLPPPPPPPPCMPPPPPVFSSCGDDMASMLANKQGTLRRGNKQNDNGSGGAIDAIVDQIKGGKFQLKSRENNFLEKKPKEEQPEAVKEMLAILGTLRKRRPTSNTRPVVDYTDF